IAPAKIQNLKGSIGRRKLDVGRDVVGKAGSIGTRVLLLPRFIIIGIVLLQYVLLGHVRRRTGAATGAFEQTDCWRFLQSKDSFSRAARQTDGTFAGRIKDLVRGQMPASMESSSLHVLNERDWCPTVS